MNINKIKREFNSKVIFPLKCKIINTYDSFRMWELCFRMKHCKDKVIIEDCETFAEQVGDNTAYRIFESMMEECYSDPYKHGYPLDRERGNWEFRNHRYFCNDHLLLEFKVQDGNWNGTEVEYLEVTYED